MHYILCGKDNHSRNGSEDPAVKMYHMGHISVKVSANHGRVVLSPSRIPAGAVRGEQLQHVLMLCSMAIFCSAGISQTRFLTSTNCLKTIMYQVKSVLYQSNCSYT